MFFAFKGFIPVVHPSSFVHPQASVTGNVIIGRDVYVGPGAAIRGDWGGVVIEDGFKDNRVIREALLSHSLVTHNKADAIQNVRSFIRHDSEKLANCLKKIIEI